MFLFYCCFSNTDEYNPFLSAERQLLELLECDDFQPYSTESTQSITRPQTTNITHNKSSNSDKKTPAKSAPKDVNKRASVIDPPPDFVDKLSALDDNFALIESFLNDNEVFNNQKRQIDDLFSNGKVNDNNSFNLRKYSDDSSSIDPDLINENDNLSIPDHLKYSPTSTLDNYSSDATLQNDTDVDHYSIQYDKKISSLEPYVQPKTETDKQLKRSVSMLDDDFIVTPLKTSSPKVKPALQRTKSLRGAKSSSVPRKSTNASVNSSFGPSRGANLDNSKKSLNYMKRSVNLAPPAMKPKTFKTKDDVLNYFSEQERRNSSKNGKASPEKSVSVRFDTGCFN